MSIEKLLGDLIDAVKENTAALKESGDAAAKPASKPAAKKPTAAESKAATEAAAKQIQEEDAAKKEAAAKKPAARRTTKKATMKDLVAAAKGYLGGTEDESELDERRANVAAMSDHFGVAKISEVPEDSIAEAIGFFKQLEETGAADYMNEGSAEEEDDLV